jgi:hypothetical protein
VLDCNETPLAPASGRCAPDQGRPVPARCTVAIKRFAKAASVIVCSTLRAVKVASSAAARSCCRAAKSPLFLGWASLILTLIGLIVAVSG